MLVNQSLLKLLKDAFFLTGWDSFNYQLQTSHKTTANQKIFFSAQDSQKFNFTSIRQPTEYMMYCQDTMSPNTSSYCGLLMWFLINFKLKTRRGNTDHSPRPRFAGHARLDLAGEGVILSGGSSTSLSCLDPFRGGERVGLGRGGGGEARGGVRDMVTMSGEGGKGQTADQPSPPPLWIH